MNERVLLKSIAPYKVGSIRSILHSHTSKPKVRASTGHSFDYPTTLVGTTPTWKGADGGVVAVFVDPALGQTGLSLAQGILSRIDALMSYCDSVFGVKGKSGNVIIAALDGATDGSAGAYHYGCSFNSDFPGSDWYEDFAIGNPDEVFGLVMAEVSESYMGLQGKGWSCGGSGGEGLSRFLAQIVSGGPNGALRAYASGPAWDGTDWISKDQGTDGDYPSIGCAVLYCWWMTSLGYSPAQIVQAGESDGTLASNYTALTGKTKALAFADFTAAVRAAGGPTSDNPFRVATPIYPLPPTPTPVPSPIPVPVPNPTPIPLFHFTLSRLVRAGGSVTLHGVPTMVAGGYEVSSSSHKESDRTSVKVTDESSSQLSPPPLSPSMVVLSGLDSAGNYLLIPVPDGYQRLVKMSAQLGVPWSQLLQALLTAILGVLGGQAQDAPTVLKQYQ